MMARGANRSPRGPDHPDEDRRENWAPIFQPRKLDAREARGLESGLAMERRDEEEPPPGPLIPASYWRKVLARFAAGKASAR